MGNSHLQKDHKAFVLKRLAPMPGIKWKKACNPSGYSTSQASGVKTKGSKIRSSLRSPAQLKHKKSALEEYIDSLDDYVQKEWALVRNPPRRLPRGG